MILDYYNGNVEYLSNEQRGERVREHLGLYLIPENSPEDKLANEKTLELAKEILEKKKAELLTLWDMYFTVTELQSESIPFIEQGRKLIRLARRKSTIGMKLRKSCQ